MVSDQVVGIIERSLLEKYLTTQSGYMALMLLVLIPFVKTMLLTDFVAVVPLENMIVTLVLVAMLALANFKDKRQEHSTAAAQLSNPKVIQSAVDSFSVLSSSLKEMQMTEIRKAVRECMDEFKKANGIAKAEEPKPVVEPENITSVDDLEVLFTG